MVYLRAYQAYQQRNFDLCLKLLQEMEQNDTKRLDLQAQVHYQKKEYQAAYDIYRQLISKGGEYQEERKENLSTLIVSAELEQPGVLKVRDSDVPTEEEIVSQVELIKLNDESVYDLFSKPEPSKRRTKHKKRKIRLPKQYDAVAGPDPERWLPRRDRKSNAYKQKKRRQRPNVKPKARAK